jgi:hypothetical protein
MQTPVASAETRGGTWLRGMLFLTARQFSLFFPGTGQSDRNNSFDERASHEVSCVSESRTTFMYMCITITNFFYKSERRRFGRVHLFSLRFRIKWRARSNATCVCDRRNSRHLAKSTHSSIYNGSFDFLEVFILVPCAGHRTIVSILSCPFYAYGGRERTVHSVIRLPRSGIWRRTAHRIKTCACDGREIKSAHSTGKVCTFLLVTSTLCLLLFLWQFFILFVLYCSRSCSYPVPHCGERMKQKQSTP